MAIEVHTELGPGLLENTYKHCLFFEIAKAGLLVEVEKPMPFIYKSIRMDCGYRFDLLVENKLIIEIKSVDVLNDIHLTQTLTYLKLSNCKLGLLINFNLVQQKNGIRRLINGQL